MLSHNTRQKHSAIPVTSKWRKLNPLSKETRAEWQQSSSDSYSSLKHTRIAIKYSSSFVSSEDCAWNCFPGGRERKLLRPAPRCTVIAPGASWWPHDPVTCNKTPWETWKSIASVGYTTWLRLAECEYTQDKVDTEYVHDGYQKFLDKGTIWDGNVSSHKPSL